jgi:hypothetical protein
MADLERDGQFAAAFHHAVDTPPSGRIQNTSRWSRTRTTAFTGPPCARAAWGAVSGQGLRQPWDGFQAVVPIAPSGAVQNTSSWSGLRAAAASVPARA